MKGVGVCFDVLLEVSMAGYFPCPSYRVRAMNAENSGWHRS